MSKLMGHPVTPPLMIERQGGFAVGGALMETAGDFDPTALYSATGNTGHVDHAYVWYQEPVDRKGDPVLLWHGGAGLHSACWTTTPDGHPSFRDLLLSRGKSVYVLDQRGRAAAGSSSEKMTLDPEVFALDKSLWQAFRLGLYPRFFDGIQFARTPQAIEQLWRQRVPKTSSEWFGAESDPAELTTILSPIEQFLNRVGRSHVVTSSRGGHYGFRAVTDLTRGTELVSSIVSYEPMQCVFSESDPAARITTDNPDVARTCDPVLISAAAFERLAEVPIQIVFGDNIPTLPSPIGGLELWRVAHRMAEQFVDSINRIGGKAELLDLAAAGLNGNTHLPFMDLNNAEVAELYLRFTGDSSDTHRLA